MSSSAGWPTRLPAAAFVVGFAATLNAFTPLHITATVQDRRKQPAVVFRVSTELVQFDAIVVEGNGEPVTSLTRDDFDVRQDGVPVLLLDATYVDRMSSTIKAAEHADRPPRTGIDVEPLVFLIDDMAMTPDGFRRVLRALRRFTTEALPSGVEVGILRTGEIGWRTTALTADRTELLRRIDSMRYLARSVRPGLASGSGAYGPGTTTRERTFIEGTLGSVNSLIANLNRLPGRKTLVLLSEGVAIRPTGEWHAEPIDARLNRVSQLAAEAGVTTHTVDVSSLGSAASLEGRMTLKDGLVALAERMSGLYFGNNNDLAVPLEKIASLQSGYYLLSYEPPPGTFVNGPNPPFRRLSVRVRRSGLSVRTRAGFFGSR